MNDPEEALPISMLNQLEYCERRFYLMHVLGEMEINVHVLEGTLRHEQAHSGQRERQGHEVLHRRVYVWSERLGIAGFCDIVEETPGGLCPVEYKKGRMGRWLNDHIQLCAQALCLEERLGVKIEAGSIFYFGSRRREEVSFSAELRQRCTEAVGRARQIAALPAPPSPDQPAAKCHDCSLQPVCLPREVSLLAIKQGAGPALAASDQTGRRPCAPTGEKQL